MTDYQNRGVVEAIDDMHTGGNSMSHIIAERAVKGELKIPFEFFW